MLRKITSLFTDPLFYVIAFLLVLNWIQPILAIRNGQYDSQTLSGLQPTSASRSYKDTARLTYKEFEELQRKQEYAENARASIDRGNQGSGSNTHIIGFEQFGECFTCNTAEEYHKNKEARTTNYYLVLPGYTLRDDHSSFYMHNGQPRLEYVIWDKVDTLVDEGLHRSGHYADKPLPFRFSYRNKDHEKERNGRVLIPISKTTFHAFNIPVFILFVVLGLIWLLLGIIRPLKVLFRVSRGIVFTQQNVRELFTAAWFWTCTPFVIVLLRFILRLIFHKNITSDVQLMFWSALREYQFWIIGGLILLAIATAFRKGLSLQNEQNLTI